jgi:hypothetical protein
MCTGGRDEPVSSLTTRNIGIILSGMQHQPMGVEPIRLPAVGGLARLVKDWIYAEGQSGD